MITTTIIILSLIFQFLFVLTNLLGLPGSIISAIIPLIWVFTPKISVFQFIFIVAIIVSGEMAEFFSSVTAGSKDTTSILSIITSIVFSFILAIVMAPLFFGLGAVIGSFAGAFLGTFIYEYISTGDAGVSIQKGKTALRGRFLGTMVKIALGISSVILTGSYLL